MRKTSSTFKLEMLPPTSAAAKYHTYRAYFTVQEWLGNVAHLNPTNWGWEVKDGMLISILTDRPVDSKQYYLAYHVVVKQFVLRDANAVKLASIVHLCVLPVQD